MTTDKSSGRERPVRFADSLRAAGEPTAGLRRLRAAVVPTAERPRERVHRAALAVVLLLYLGLGIAYSVVVPIFEAPDETSHFAYARYVAETGSLPVQDVEHSGPFGQEGSQPPLYYVLVALLVRPVDMSDTDTSLWNNPQNVMGHPAVPGNKNRFVHTDAERFPYRGAALAVHLGRLVSIVMGAGTVWLTYLMGRRVFRRAPNLQLLALAAAAFVAFLPGFLFISAAVNNDGAVALFSTATLYLLLRLVQQPADSDSAALIVAGRRPEPLDELGTGSVEGRRQHLGTAAALGAALGLALMSKLSALLLIPFVVVVLAITGWRRGLMRRYTTLTLIALLVAFVIAGWWFARNIWLYGDPVGANVATAIAARRSFRLDTYLGGAWAEFRGLRWSFWGLFGWFSLLLPRPVYAVLDVLTIAAFGGLALAVWYGRQGRWAGLWSGPLTILGVWALAVFVGLVAWTTQTKGAHGRLLFPAISAIALLFVVGWRTWIPPRFRRATPVLVGVPMLVFALWALIGVIRPAYARPALIAPGAVPDQVARSPITFAVSPDERIRLLGASTEPADAMPGETVALTLYWQALKQVTRDVLLNIRLFGHDMALLVNEDTYPGWGTFPPSLWPSAGLTRENVVVDRYHFQLPPDAAAPTLVRVDVGFVGRWTGQRWPAVDAQGESLSGPVSVAVLRLHRPVEDAAYPVQPAARLADGILLLDYRVAAVGRVGNEGMGEVSVRPGDELTITLEWAAAAPPSPQRGETVAGAEVRGDARPSSDYTVFLHLVDEQGRIVTQADGPPRSGDYPTSNWLPGERVPEQRSLQLPEDTRPGTYHLVVGMYSPDTLDRLGATNGAGQPWPDNAIELGASIDVSDSG